MDICMIGIIIVSCALMKLLIDWCESQVGRESENENSGA